MRIKARKASSKYLGTLVFLLILFLNEAFPNAAFAFTSLNACARSKECLELIKGSSSSAVSAPTGAGFGSSTLSTTTNSGTVKTLVQGVTDFAIVSGPTAVYVGWHYWDEAHNRQAQNRAKQRYCAAYPTDAVCPKVEEPYYIWFDNTSQQPQYLCVLSHTWGPAFGGSSPYLQGNVDLIDILGQAYSYGYFTEDVYWGKGVNHPVNGSPPTCSFNPAPEWKDWPQEKRDAAVGLLTNSDWQRLITSMPFGGTLDPGDTVKAPQNCNSRARVG